MGDLYSHKKAVNKTRISKKKADPKQSQLTGRIRAERKVRWAKVLVVPSSALRASFPSRGGYLSGATSVAPPPLLGEAFPLLWVLFLLLAFSLLQYTFAISNSNCHTDTQASPEQPQLTERFRHKDKFVIIEVEVGKINFFA